MQFSEFVAVVKFLVKSGKDLDQALEELSPPVNVREKLITYFSNEVQISPVSQIVSKESGYKKTSFQLSGVGHPYLDYYKRSLQNIRGWDDNTINNIIDTSTSILNQMPDPVNNVKFKARGLVVGHVQSGKTASMAGVISSAADAGYRIVIVMAGLLNDLRLQTQNRMDQDVTGVVDDESLEVGEHLDGVKPWVRLTKGFIDGDIKKARTEFVATTDRPTIAIIKKHPVKINRS